MRQILLVVATAGSIGIGYLVGNSYSSYRGSITRNMCLTDKALVSNMQETLADVKPKDIATIGRARWEHYRSQQIRYMYDIRDAAPCSITVQVPPDIKVSTEPS